MNRVAVAATLLIEGPWTFFILAPHLALRRFAAATQVLLQVGILFTGNYNFFNLLTLVLALAVLDLNTGTADKPESEAHCRASLYGWIAKADSRWQRFQNSSRATTLMWFATVLYCLCTAAATFAITTSVDGEQPDQARTLEMIFTTTSIRFLLSVDDIQAWIARVLPASVVFAACVTVFASLWQMLRAAALLFQSNRRHLLPGNLWTKLMYLFISTAANAWVFSPSVLTLSTLDPPFQRSMPPFVTAAYQATEKYRVTSPYGLFRSMTGVGTVERGGQQRELVVARPEIILEGTVDEGRTWHEYHFQHKPGDVSARPTRATPMQPRVDWQMWFAALGDYNSAPWLVHLVQKLLEGSSDVKELLDTHRDPFPVAPPQAVRARLYYYDFTRSNKPWSRGRLNPAFDVGNDAVAALDTGDSYSKQERPHWWSRVFVREYMPALERGNPSLQSFVHHHYGVRDAVEYRCSHSVTSSEMCTMLQTLVRSEHSPFGLAAIVLVAKVASSWTIEAAAGMWTRTRGARTKLKQE